MRTRIWIAATLGIVVLIGLAGMWHHPAQPTWRGKTVAALFTDFRAARSLHVTNSSYGGQVFIIEDPRGLFDDQASTGLRAIGPYAVRWLEKEVAHGDGFWIRNYQSLYPKLPTALRTRLPCPPYRAETQADAAMAIAAIGSNAAPAIPTILKALGKIPGPESFYFLAAIQNLPLKEGDLDYALERWSKDRSSSGSTELWFIENLDIRTPAAARVWTNALRLTQGLDRAMILCELPRFVAHADIIVPALTRTILEDDQGSREQAVRVIGQFRARSDLAIPALLRGIRAGKGEARSDCIRALGALQAEPAGVDLLLKELVEAHETTLAATLATELKMQTPLAINVLTNSLSGSQMEREIAALGLSRVSAHTDRCLPILINMLHHPDLKIRSQSVHILKHLGDLASPAIPAMVKALNGADEGFRYDVVYALLGMGTNGLRALDALSEADDRFVEAKAMP